MGRWRVVELRLVTASLPLPTSVEGQRNDSVRDKNLWFALNQGCKALCEPSPQKEPDFPV